MCFSVEKVERKVMKKTTVIKITCICVAVLLLAALKIGIESALINQTFDDLGNRDWAVELMNGYYIVQINGKEVHLINDNWNEQTNNEQTDIVVGHNIAAYSCNDCYIGVKCTRANLDEQTSDYSIDAYENTVYGPYSEERYIEIINDTGIKGLDNWTNTVPRPADARYDIKVP